MSATELTEFDLAARSVGGVSHDADAIAGEIAHRHGITVVDLKGPSRVAHLSRARHELYRRLRELGWSFPTIGRFVGGRDHTTVIKALWSSKRKAERYEVQKERSKGRPFRKAHWLGPAGAYVEALLSRT